MKKISVGILGATGIVGQNYLSLLQNHPWFDVTFLAASEKSAHKPYREAIKNRWHLPNVLNDSLLDQRVLKADDIKSATKQCSLVFSALSGEKTKEIEELYAKNDIGVVSNASCHRLEKDVPLLIPELNPQHLDIIEIQRKNRGWKKGFIVCKPNCSIQSYLIPLYPLHLKYRVKKVIVTTLQAISGGGYPGVPSYDVLSNVVPFIPKEEEKSEIEPLKILGKINNNHIEHETNLSISAHCTRVPVVDGHIACVSLLFEKKPSLDAILNDWKNFSTKAQNLKLPSAPDPLIVYLDTCNRPQPRKDVHMGNGMAISVGRLRECNTFDIRFVGLSHNVIRGAAGGGILNMELIVKRGLVN